MWVNGLGGLWGLVSFIKKELSKTKGSNYRQKNSLKLFPGDGEKKMENGK